MKNIKKKQYLLLALIVGLILLGGLFLFMNRQQTNTDTQYEDTIQVSAPSGTVDEETGEVNQTAFEENQQVSEDTSLETIETELNSTVILEEDFSDL